MKFTRFAICLWLVGVLAFVWVAAPAVAQPLVEQRFVPASMVGGMESHGSIGMESAVDEPKNPVADDVADGSGASAAPGDRAWLLAVLLVAIGVPYWLGVACVKRCHREGWTVYTKRRHVVAWAILPPVLLLAILFLLGGNGESRAVRESDEDPATLAMLIFPVAWLALQAHAAARLNPGLGARSWCIVWQARVGAALIALVVSWFLLTTLQSKPRDGQSHAQHAVRKALWLAVLGWIGATYLNFVCDPAKARLRTHEAEV